MFVTRPHKETRREQKKSRSVRRVDIERAARAREDERKGKEAKEEKKGSISEKLVSRNHYTFCGSSRWFSFSRRLDITALNIPWGATEAGRGKGELLEESKREKLRKRGTHSE